LIDCTSKFLRIFTTKLSLTQLFTCEGVRLSPLTL